MAAFKHSYLVDEDGNRVGVVLDISEYQRLMNELEELESIRAFDAAKASAEEPVAFEQAVAEIERHR